MPAVPHRDLRGLRALFYGRFQPFHLGHLRLLEWILQRFDKTLILIGMADESYTPRNPFTADERAEMIEIALETTDIDLSRVDIATMPTLPIGKASAYLVKHYSPGFDIVVTNNVVIGRAFRDAGFRVLKPPFFEREKLQGKIIRELMAKNDPRWRTLVPKPVADYIEEIKGVERIQEILKIR